MRTDGSDSMRTHGPHFYAQVAEMVKAYSSRPIPTCRSTNSPRRISAGLECAARRRAGDDVQELPSFPQRYMERLEMPAADCSVRVEPLKPVTQPILYTEKDLHVQFTGSRTSRRKGQGQAA